MLQRQYNFFNQDSFTETTGMNRTAVRAGIKSIAEMGKDLKPFCKADVLSYFGLCLRLLSIAVLGLYFLVQQSGLNCLTACKIQRLGFTVMAEFSYLSSLCNASSSNSSNSFPRKFPSSIYQLCDNKIDISIISPSAVQYCHRSISNKRIFMRTATFAYRFHQLLPSELEIIKCIGEILKSPQL